MWNEQVHWFSECVKLDFKYISSINKTIYIYIYIYFYRSIDINAEIIYCALDTLIISISKKLEVKTSHYEYCVYMLLEWWIYDLKFHRCFLCVSIRQGPKGLAKARAVRPVEAGRGLKLTAKTHETMMAWSRFSFSKWWFQILLHFRLYLGKIANLTNILELGWNHQSAIFLLKWSLFSLILLILQGGI